MTFSRNLDRLSNNTAQHILDASPKPLKRLWVGVDL